MSFLQELRRRKVFRVAALYIVGAWVVLQVSDLAFESWEITSSTLRYVWLGAILGFPIALIFGWRYDITTQGIVRTPSADTGEQIDPSLRHTDYVVLIFLVVVAVSVIYQVTIQIIGSPRPVRSEEINRRQIDPNSIAVLPLDNLSGDSEQAYFVSGMHDALIAGLSRISALRVTSKTSTLRFRDSVESLPLIAAQLGVARLIEGSVFRVDDRVRITVNLVDAILDQHIWSRTFENEIENVLLLQNEVAQAIAQQVEVTITPLERAQLTSAKSVNPEAYDAYLKSQILALDAQRDPESSIQAAERVIELDPTFAPGYASLSDLYGYLAMTTNVTDGDAYLRSRQLARKAVELDPNLPYARTALARVHWQFEWDWAAAQTEFEHALKLDPNNAATLQMFGAYRVLIHNDCEGGLALLAAARDRDPFSPEKYFDLGVYNFHCRHPDESIKNMQRTNELLPEFYWARMVIAWNYAIKGSFEQAADQCDNVFQEVAENFDPTLIGSCSWIYSLAERTELARQLLEKLRNPPAGVHIDPLTISYACLGLGEIECTFFQLKEALRQRNSGMTFLRFMPIFDPIRDDPRYQALLEQMSFPS
jgi:TolB-like protein/Tfp pilus assembly protein PilF